MAIQEKNLKVDAKKRISLGKLANDNISSYDAELQEDGVIILKPKVEISAAEVWLYKNPEALASVLRGIEDSKTGRIKSRGSFSQYADDEIE